MHGTQLHIWDLRWHFLQQAVEVEGAFPLAGYKVKVELSVCRHIGVLESCLESGGISEDPHELGSISLPSFHIDVAFP